MKLPMLLYVFHQHFYDLTDQLEEICLNLSSLCIEAMEYDTEVQRRNGWRHATDELLCSKQRPVVF